MCDSPTLHILARSVLVLDYFCLPVTYRGILTGCPEPTEGFRAIIKSPVKTVGVTFFQLCLMDLLRVTGSDALRTVTMRNISIRGLVVAPFYSAN